MDYTTLETGEISFSGWTVQIAKGKGSVSDQSGTEVATFDINSSGHVILTEGECKFADLALIALRSFVRYGCPQTV